MRTGPVPRVGLLYHFGGEMLDTCQARHLREVDSCGYRFPGRKYAAALKFAALGLSIIDVNLPDTLSCENLSAVFNNYLSERITQRLGSAQRHAHTRKIKKKSEEKAAEVRGVCSLDNMDKFFEYNPNPLIYEIFVDHRQGTHRPHGL